MGISLTVAEFAGKIERGGAELKKQERSATLKAAKVLQRGAMSTLNMAAPGGHLRNVKNSALAVRATSTADGAMVAAAGKAYAILDNPTRGHWIGQGRSRKVKGFGPARPGQRRLGKVEFGPGIGGGRQVLRIGGREVTGPVFHPGTHGKHTFSIGTEAATPEAFATLIEEMKIRFVGVF